MEITIAIAVTTFISGLVVGMLTRSRKIKALEASIRVLRTTVHESKQEAIYWRIQAKTGERLSRK